MATALLLTLPGIPCVYTGDELGEAFRPYFDAVPLTWREQVPGLRDYHRRLIHLRGEQPSLHSREWQVLDLEPHQWVYGYLRSHDEGQDPAMVLLNFSDQDHEVEVKLPDTFSAFGRRALVDRITDARFQVSVQGEVLRLALPAYTSVILQEA